MYSFFIISRTNTFSKILISSPISIAEKNRVKFFDMESTLMRWREPYIKHLAKLSAHTDRFIMAKGNCSHFTYMSPELMQKTLKLKRQIDEYHYEYRDWIETSGVVKNPARFLIE